MSDTSRSGRKAFLPKITPKGMRRDLGMDIVISENLYQDNKVLQSAPVKRGGVNDRVFRLIGRGRVLLIGVSPCGLVWFQDRGRDDADAEEYWARVVLRFINEHCADSLEDQSKWEAAIRASQTYTGTLDDLLPPEAIEALAFVKAEQPPILSDADRSEIEATLNALVFLTPELRGKILADVDDGVLTDLDRGATGAHFELGRIAMSLQHELQTAPKRGPTKAMRIVADGAADVGDLEQIHAAKNDMLRFMLAVVVQLWTDAPGHDQQHLEGLGASWAVTLLGAEEAIFKTARAVLGCAEPIASPPRNDPAKASSPKTSKKAKILKNKKTDARDKWLYEEAKSGEKTYRSIMLELNKIAANKGWSKLGSPQAVEQAIRRYIRRHGKPALPPRKEQ
jgi:hypothetical protein